MPYYPPSGGSSNSAGLAGTVPYYILNSGNATLPNSLIIKAGSSVTLASDATAVYVNATTSAGGGASSFAFPNIKPYGNTSFNFMPIVSTITQGTTDIYTCPTGKKAVLVGYNIIPSSTPAGGGTVGFQPAIKIGTGYYYMNGRNTVGPNSASGAGNDFTYILEEGESFAMLTSGASLNVYVNAYLIGTDIALKTAKLTNFNSGFTLFYSVPTNALAHLYPLGFVPGSGSNQAFLTYFNTMGVSVINGYFAAASGVVVYTETHLLIGSANTSNGSRRQSGNSVFTLGSGYTVSIFTGTDSTVGQFAWMTVLETS